MRKPNEVSVLKARYKAWDDELASLRTEFEALRTLYEQYFAGVEKRQPLRKREQFELKLRRSKLGSATKPTVRFQFGTMQQRYASYRTYWDRVLRQIEEGTFTREGFGKFRRGPLTPDRVKKGDAVSKRDEGREAADAIKAREARVQSTSDEAQAFLDSLK